MKSLVRILKDCETLLKQAEDEVGVISREQLQLLNEDSITASQYILNTTALSAVLGALTASYGAVVVARSLADSGARIFG